MLIIKAPTLNLQPSDVHPNLVRVMSPGTRNRCCTTCGLAKAKSSSTRWEGDAVIGYRFKKGLWNPGMFHRKTGPARMNVHTNL